LGHDAPVKADHPWDMAGDRVEIMGGQQNRHALAI
jgi:hypothetical protein